MDFKEYIASGIIEGYVLGSLSDQERREVECMSAIYPELKDHLNQIQESFEAFAQASAIEPPKELRQTILKKISTLVQEENEQGVTGKKETKIVQLNPKKESNLLIWKWSVAASLILLLGTTILYINDKKTQQLNLASLTEKNKIELKRANLLQSDLEEKEKIEQFMLASSTIPIQLSGTPKSPTSKVRVFYNSQQNEALLSMDVLPKVDKDKQYQLWAIVDGLPHDLGVFDLPENKSLGSIIPVEMTKIQAFAITLEKKGGSASPNLEQLYVIGNI